MSAFLYFVPTDKPSLAREDLDRLGLSYAVDAGNPMARGTRGPEGLTGLIFRGDGKNGGYDPACQAWRKGPKVDGETRYWVALPTNEPKPGPAELARPRQISGEPVRLRDGKDWIVPIARSFVRGSTLPKELALGEDGETWAPADLPEYMGLCRHAERFFAMWEEAASRESEDERGIRLDFKDGMAIVVEALRVNYRVGPAEVSMLRLCTDVEMFEVTRAICDLPAFERVLVDRAKKESASASSSTGDGSEATSPATCPPSAT